MQAALGSGSVADFKTAFYDSVKSGITSAIIDSLMEKALYESSIALFGADIETAISRFVDSGYSDTTLLDAVLGNLGTFVDNLDPLIQKLIDAEQSMDESFSLGSSSTTTEHVNGVTYLSPDQIAAYNAAQDQAISDWYAKQAELMEMMPGIRNQVADALGETTELERLLRDNDETWAQIQADIAEAYEYGAASMEDIERARQAYIQSRDQIMADFYADLTQPFHDLANDLADMQYSLAGFSTLLADYYKITGYLQQHGYQAQWTMSDVSGMIPANMGTDEMEEYLPLIQEAFSDFFSIMSDRWSRWESIEDQARALYDQMSAGVDTASVLETVPVLDTAAMDETFGENTLVEAERYIAELTEWVSAALDVRRQIADFNKSHRIPKNRLANRPNLFRAFHHCRPGRLVQGPACRGHRRHGGHGPGRRPGKGGRAPRPGRQFLRDPKILSHGNGRPGGKHPGQDPGIDLFQLQPGPAHPQGGRGGTILRGFVRGS